MKLETTVAEAARAPHHWPNSVLILYEGSNRGGDFGLSFAEGFRDQGCEVDLLARNEPWSDQYDLVLAYGPFSQSTSMLPVARRLLASKPERRPVFIWWLTEGMPDPCLPSWLVDGTAKVRLALDRYTALLSGSGGLLARFRESSFWSRGHRLRIFGELCWLQSRSVLDVLAVTSASRAAYLRRRGFEPIVVPLGYHPIYGTDLGLLRDVDVCFLGSTDSKRRRLLLGQIKGELKRRGVELSVQTHLYHDSRTRFLNRTKVMLNILRAPQDFVGQRFLLGAANKTLVITEPINDSEPFVDGRHLIVAPLARLAETVEFYLSHEEERRPIVEEAYRFATQQLTISQMIARILEHARKIRSSRFAPSHV